MKRCEMSLGIWEMHIRTIGYHLTTVRMAFIKKTGNSSVLARMWGKGNPWVLFATTTMENSMDAPRKIKNRTTTGSSKFPLQGIYQEVKIGH